jgi:hypothetical protein
MAWRDQVTLLRARDVGSHGPLGEPRQAARLAERADAVMMAAALLALAPAAASAAIEELRVMFGGPDQSQAHRLADLLADPLAEYWAGRSRSSTCRARTASRPPAR